VEYVRWVLSIIEPIDQIGKTFQAEILSDGQKVRSSKSEGISSSLFRFPAFFFNFGRDGSTTRRLRSQIWILSKPPKPQKSEEKWVYGD
jgi:hypothetical protein